MLQKFSCFFIVLTICFTGWTTSATARTNKLDLSQGLSSHEFAEIITTFSEPDNTQNYHWDNFISNEESYLTIFPGIHKYLDKNNGVYIGVGPDQSFTYIAQTRPQVAFITDIRYQNLLEHLLFKACFDLANNPRDYLQLLFAQHGNTIDELLDNPVDDSYNDVYAAKIFNQICACLTEKYNLKLSQNDFDILRKIHEAFWKKGGQIRFEDMDGHPTLSSLVRTGDNFGNQLNYLKNPEVYNYVRSLQQKNLIIPIVGDIAGTKALEMIGKWCKARSLKLSLIYISNVEDYLYSESNPKKENDAVWKRWHTNLDHLPITSRSILLRTGFPGTSYGMSSDHPLKKPSYGNVTAAYLVKDYLRLYHTHPRNYSYCWSDYLPTQ